MARSQVKMIFGWGLRCILGLSLLLSSLPKLSNPYEFFANVCGYELLGPKGVLIVATVLPWLELLVGIALLTNICVGGALVASVTMGAVFTVAQASALYRGLEISCGCFSQSDASKISYATLLRAVMLLLCAGAAWWAWNLASRGARSEALAATGHNGDRELQG